MLRLLTLKTWAFEHPLIFYIACKTPTSEPFCLNSPALQLAPEIFFVAPDVDEIKARYWDSKKITAIKSSFDDFMTAVDGLVPHISVATG